MSWPNFFGDWTKSIANTGDRLSNKPPRLETPFGSGYLQYLGNTLLTVHHLAFGEIVITLNFSER